MNPTTHFKLSLAAAAFSGLLVAAGFPGHQFPTLSLAVVLPIAFVPLFVAIDTLPTAGTATASRHHAGSSARVTPITRGLRAFLLCWVMGAVMAAFAFFWTTDPAIYFGRIPKSLTYLGFAVYSIASGLFFPLMLSPFIFNVARTARRSIKPFPVLAMVCVSTLLEMWIPRFFFWSIGSLMHASDAINQWSAVLGFNGVSGFVFLSNAFLARGFTDQPRSPGRVVVTGIAIAAFWGVVYGLGLGRIEIMEDAISKAPTTQVGFIQPNFTFSELSSNPTRAPDAQAQSLETLLRMSSELVEEAGSNKLDLIVWPESVAPGDFAWSKEQQDATRAFTARTQVPILVQAIEYDEAELQSKGQRHATIYSNSFLMRPDGSKSSVFRKWVPIPFGESVPFESHFPGAAELLRENVGNLSKVGVGNSYNALPYTPDFYVAPLICFDSINPELARMQTLKGNAGIFVNQANFVWMGMSNAGAEFHEINRFRAIENSRSLLMAANTGPSAAFDPLGREILSPTQLMTQAKKIVALPVMSNITFYTMVGTWPLVIAGLFSVLVLLYQTARPGSGMKR